MSYDITFVKYDKKPQMAASKIYEALMDGKDVPGLEVLPDDEIKRAILESFSKWKINGEKPLDLEKDDVSFQVEFESQYIRSDWCGRDFPVYAPRLRQLLGTRFGLHMYDAQSDVLREVIDGKTALNRITEIRELFKQKFEKHGYKPNLRFFGFKQETNDAVLTVLIEIYEQNKSDVVTVRPTFRLSYPKLDALANENVKSVRPNVAYREYYLIAMSLLNRGMIDDKTLTKLLAKAEKVDDGFDPACVDRIRGYKGS